MNWLRGARVHCTELALAPWLISLCSCRAQSFQGFRYKSPLGTYGMARRKMTSFLGCWEITQWS